MKISLSDAVQKLTIFIHFLEWIRYTDGNFGLAGRLRTVIKRVVECVLDSPQPEQPQLEKEVNENDLNFSSDLALDQPDGDTLDWLNTLDWTQGAWLGVD